MADVDQTVALGIKAPTAPDVIGPITSLAQLQYMAAQGAKLQADTALVNQSTQFGAAKIGSLQNYMKMLQSGTPSEEAIVKSGVSALDPTGADAALKNVQQQRELTVNKTANPSDPSTYSLAGPAAVGAASTALSTQATTAETQLKNRTTMTQLYGQLGNVMASDPSPAGRAQAAALAKAEGFSDKDIQPFMKLPDDQYVMAGKHFQQASMTPEKYMDTSGQTEYNQGAAKAATAQRVLGPGDKLSSGIAADAAMRGAPLPPAPGSVPQAAMPAVPAPAAAAQAPGPNYYSAVAKHESGNDPTAGDPSRAYGLYQFMPQTWKTIMQQHPELGLTSDGRSNPVQATKAAQAFTADNAAALANAGVPITDKNVFMAHFLGAGGATKFFQAAQQDPNANAASIFPKEAAANPTLFYVGGKTDQPRSLGSLYGLMTKSFGDGNTTGAAPPANGASIAPGVPGNRPAVPAAMPMANAPMAPGAAPILPAGLSPSPSVQSVPTPSTLPVRPVGTAPLPTAPIPAPAPVAAAQPPAPTPVAPVAPSPVQAPTQQPLPIAAAAGARPPPTGLAADATAPLPGSFQPVTHGIGMAAQAFQTGLGEAQAAQFKEAKEGYQQATIGQQNLGQLQEHLSSLAEQGGWLTPGPGAEERIGWAKALNTAQSAAGFKTTFDPKDIADAEAAQKITGKLGFDTSAVLGKHEAAAITTQAIKLNPGIVNTPAGAKLVASSINAGLQRQRDFYQYLSAHADDRAADIAFAKTHPTAMYVRDAQALAKIPQTAVDILRQNADDPWFAERFDKRWGAGLSRYYTETTSEAHQ